MAELDVSNKILDRVAPFYDDVLSGSKALIDSIYITGSALTADFDSKKSDINSVFVLKKMDFNFLSVLAPLGKKYGKKGVAAPLIMTPEYILNSLDVFPIEFLNIKLLHHTVFGEDLFGDLEIKKADLRYQCERELKVKLIGLRQGYLSAAGDRRVITQNFVNSITGYIPLFRGIIVLFGKEPPVTNSDVLTLLQAATGVNTDVFKTVLKEKRERTKLSLEGLNNLFEAYYNTTEKLGEVTDGITE